MNKSLIAALVCGFALGAADAAPQAATGDQVRADDGMVAFVKKRVRHHRVVTRTTHRHTATTHKETHSSSAGSAAK